MFSSPYGNNSGAPQNGHGANQMYGGSAVRPFTGSPANGGFAPGAMPGRNASAPGASLMPGQPRSKFDQWKASIIGKKNDNVVIDNDQQSVRAAAGDDGLLTVVHWLNINTSAESLAANPDQAVVATNFDTSRLHPGDKLIPLASTVTHVKNTSAVDLLYDLTGTDINIEASLPVGSASGHVLLPANTPLVAFEMPLYTCDPDKASDINRFKGWHRITSDTLNNAVVIRVNDDSGDEPSAMIRCGSALYAMIKPNLNNLGLVFADPTKSVQHPSVNAGFEKFGDEQVLLLPAKIADEHIARGEQLLAALPFRDPGTLRGTLKRLDGKTFTDVAPYVGNAIGSEHTEDIALRGSFQAMAVIKSIYRIWRD